MKNALSWFCSAFLVLLIVIVVLGPAFTDAYTQNVDSILLPPSEAHWFGTDSLGRDLFARVLSGGRVSLVVGFFATLLSFGWALIYGATAGWLAGRVDQVMMRFCDILMAIPSFITVSIMCLMFPLILNFESLYLTSVVSLCLAISATHWMSLARVVRGLVMEVKSRPFIDAAIALGGGHFYIIRRHIFPHILSSMVVLVAMQIPTSILYESFMSFIGVGIQPPETSWGILVREGWKSLSSFPHLLLFPSLILFLTVWSAHVLLDFFRKQRRS